MNYRTDRNTPGKITLVVSKPQPVIEHHLGHLPMGLQLYNISFLSVSILVANYI